MQFSPSQREEAVQRSHSSPQKPHKPSKGFQRFRAVVAIASLVWGGLFWFRFEDLYADPTTVLEDDSPDRPLEHVEKREHLESRDEIASPQQQWRPIDRTRMNNHTKVEEQLASPSKILQQKKYQQRRHQQHIPAANTSEEETTRAEAAESFLQFSQQKKPYPRVVVIGDAFGGKEFFPTLTLKKKESNKKHPILDDNQPRKSHVDQANLEVYLRGQFSEDYQTHCVDMEEWQSHNYPVCNLMHELGILGGTPNAIVQSGLEYLGRGSWRSAFSINNQNHDEDEYDPRDLIIKLFHLADDDRYPFDIRAYEMQRVDSVISQRMTASPYVLNIYGNCGLTGIYEKGVSEIDHDARYRKWRSLDDDTKLKYAFQAATALAELHGADHPNDTSNATIVHGDIKPENLILVQRRKALLAVLGDFNYSILRKWNVTSQTPCPFYVSAAPHSWGAGYKPLEHSKGDNIPLDESIDVFALGGVLYYILVGKNPYTEYPEGEEMLAIASGKLPPLPPPLRYSNGTSSVLRDADKNGKTPPDALRVILTAIEATMKVRPIDRPTAKQVVDLFRS